MYKYSYIYSYKFTINYESGFDLYIYNIKICYNKFENFIINLN